SVIRLDPLQFTKESVLGLEEFSHLEVIYYFHLVEDEKIEFESRHPRGRKDWPRVGILAQRAKDRPNRLGVTICELVGVNGLELAVRGLDAIDGTPVLDVKPWMREFAARGTVKEPAWAGELMRNYW
ncbi:MAG: SAM-dependent methyltransferase, partial [Acidimicrobiia bacterium]|nr:SAM-dependent methyltransferase [Acidimicrobiia bacterium]